MRKFLYSLLLALCVCLPALGQKQKTSMKTLESQRAQLEKEIATLNRQLAQNSKNSSEAMTSLTLVRSKISAREKLIAGCDQTLRMLNDSIRTLRTPHPGLVQKPRQPAVVHVPALQRVAGTGTAPFWLPAEFVIPDE